MAGSTGTTRGLALFATAAFLVAAGGAGAVLVPVDGGPAGGLWLLGGWLVLAAAAGWSAEAAVARVRSGRPFTRHAETRTLHLYTTGILATALVAELTLIIARLTRGQEYATAWAAGGLLLALAGAASWRTAEAGGRYGSASGYTPSENILTIAAFALAEACGAWLTARCAAEGPLWAAWAVGGAMVALAAGFWLSDSQDWAAEDRYPKVFGATAVLGAGGVVARFALRGETVAAWWTGGVAVGGPLLVAGVLSLASASRRRRTAGAQAAPPGAQLAGILVPLGSLAWAMSHGSPWSGADSDELLLRAGRLAAAGAVLLVAQYAVLVWTGTSLPWSWAAELARRARERAERPYYSGRPPRAYDGYGPGRSASPEDEWEREHRRRDPDSLQGGDPTWPQRLLHPLLSATVTELHRRTACATGLVIDEIWPRIALVTPDAVLRQVRRGERGVLVWRITIAAALCTAGAWLLVALTGLGGFHFMDWRPAPLVGGPLLVAAVALVQARRLLAEVYETKAEAVEVYRYDLAKRLHITLPADPSDQYMIRLAAVLSGGEPPDRSGWHRPEEPELPQGARLDELAALVAQRVREGVRADVRQAVREEYAALGLRFPAGAAGGELDLNLLAREVARRTAGPVGEGLKEDLKKHLTALHRQFERDVRAAIHSSVKESVTGPALSNFVGYLAIELDRGQQDVRAEGGTVTAPAGQRVRLFVSVVRDPRAGDLPSVVESPPGRDFFVFEPVRVEGGRDTRTVSFDAMADSSTLTPLPQRRNLLVENERQTAFEFRLPEEEGGHEVWFQLYQAGHLVQVVALKVEVRAPAGATGDA
ncbi:hypothetical protein [Streptomyces lomondensis]|uniref:Uncharacterized protein n=1 Tax=Streptomyces lomondensis TaxID=68229 RepID=A0ABQ2XFY1_9ACTN|nr:hypothetical protein [Streptomyces lomondensis]MCF0080271.1 hypothetical protein [Streptomyces lomondensis]GGX15592.1 hypothetical protein GCM10010383_51980 [Streptomyces lomondensis]